MVSSRKKILSFAITALGLLALFLVAVNTGSLKVMPLELFKGLFIEYNENVATIYDLRFPRILIAIFGGAATAVSGVLLQAVMKNPLADPGIIGVSSGASLTAVLIPPLCRLSTFSRLCSRFSAVWWRSCWYTPFPGRAGFHPCGLSSWAWRSTPCLPGS